MARILVKANNVDGYTYIYTVEINRPDSTWTEVNATVYSQSGVALLSSNEKQKPMKIEFFLSIKLFSAKDQKKRISAYGPRRDISRV